MSQLFAKSIFVVFLIVPVHLQAVVNSGYIGCFKDDFENGFHFPPGDFDPSRLSPLTCMHLCSPQHKYAVLKRESACFCDNKINISLKVNDSYCSTSCNEPRDHIVGTCGGVLHHGVYEIKQGIVGLVLEVSKEIPLLKTTWFNARVLEGTEVEFRFQIDDEIVSPFSNFSSMSYVFREVGEHFVCVTTRDIFSEIATATKKLKVVDISVNAQIQCPVVARPGKEIICRGEWRRGTGAVQFHFGDGLSENILYAASLNRVGAAINQSQKISTQNNGTLGTFVFTSSIFPRRGRISHWELLASKPGKIKVQIFRPYRNTLNESCPTNTSNCYDANKITCSLGQSLCLPWKHCVPANSDQRASYTCPVEDTNTTSPGSDYELVAEDILDIPTSGHHVFNILSSKQIAVSRLDVIGWTSEGGQLSSTNNPPHIFEYSRIVHPGAKLLRHSFLKMHFTSHALCAFVRQPIRFELTHTYSLPGVYKIFSAITHTKSISINNPMSSFEIIIPQPSSTNISTLLQTGNHNGTSVMYQWDFGDGSSANTSESSITHIYHHSGCFPIHLFATNVVSNHTLRAQVEVLDPIKDCDFSQPIKAVVVGDASFIEWRCLSGSNITFTVRLGDGPVEIFKIKSDELIGNNLSHVYPSAGHFSVVILVSSPVGPNITLMTQALVEVAISGLQVNLLFPPYSQILFIPTGSNVTLARVLLRGTHAICEYDFGDVSTHVISSKSKLRHTYHHPGVYHVNVTCHNHVSSVWTELNSTIIVETAVQLNISLSVAPAVLGTPSVFKLRINHGNLFSCRWHFGDRGSLTTAFPLITSEFNHSYEEPGTYIVNVTCRNIIGVASVLVLANVDEPIDNATFIPDQHYVRVNQTVEIRLKWSGSRVQYCINCDDSVWNTRRVVTKDITMAIIHHVYAKPGDYLLVARIWNSVSSRIVSDRIIVQNPVEGLQLLVVSPSRCPSLNVMVCLNLSAPIPLPTNASALFDFGDGLKKYLKNIHFRQNILSVYHKYLHPGLHNVTVNVTNQLSSQFLMVSVNLHPSSLRGLSILYDNGSELVQGLGSNNQYFPTNNTVKFSLPQNRDDISFEWKIGNESLREAKNSVMQHVFDSPGCFNITTVIKSVTLDEDCLQMICIEEEIKDVEFNIKAPTYFKDPTLFTFPMKNIASCFLLDLGDNTTVKFGHTSCGFELQHLTTYQYLYKTQGNYSVTWRAWNHVSSIQRSIKISISEEACPYPKIHIHGGGPKHRPLVVRSSEEIVLEPIIQQKCHVAKTMIIHWKVFVVNSRGTGSEGWRMKALRSARREVTIYGNTTEESLRNEDLSMFVRDLPTELLMIELRVSFIGTDRDLGHVNVSDNTWVLVSRPPLIARMKGGLSHSVPRKSFIVLDGRKSYDPESIFNLSSLTFSWSCHPINTSISWKPKSTLGISSGCFKNSTPSLFNSSVVELATEGLLDYGGYVFSLEVQEGTRKSVFEQTVFVIEGPIPSMDLNCILNCKETVNPSQRLVFASKCLNCELNTRLIYKWSIFVCSYLITGTLTCSEIRNIGQNTSTGLTAANLAILPRVLNIGTTYKVRCSARMFGKFRSGFVEYLLEVNRPPSGGECIVTPSEGYVLKTWFNIRCFGWYDEDRPLTYLIEVRNNKDTKYLTSGGHPNMTVFLPSGDKETNFTIQVVVQVVDAMLFSSSNVRAVKAFHPRTLDYGEVVKDVRKAIERRENKLVFGMVISLCSLLNNNFNWSEQNITEPEQMRLHIAQILGETSVSSFDEMRGLSDSFEALTAKPSEVSFETQREVIRAVQNKLSVLHRLSGTSRDLVDICSTFHRIVSNILEAALLRSTLDTTKEKSSESILQALLVLDEINSVLLSQIVAEDQPTFIQTSNFDVLLSQQKLEDLTTDSKTPKHLQVNLDNTVSLLENTNLISQSILGLMVTDLSKSPFIFNCTAANSNVNSNILRLKLNNGAGSPVDLSMLDIGIFAKRKLNDIVEKTFEMNTLSSGENLKIHTFNQSVQSSALVVQVMPVEPTVKLLALLSIGQRPSFENYDFQAHFPSTNMTSGDSPFTWVLSDDFLRNYSSPGSRRYFLGITLSDKDARGINVNYTLRAFWTKCSMLDQGTWGNSGCKVGSQTTLHRTHCICRPGQAENTLNSKNTTPTSTLPPDITKSRLTREVEPFTRKKIFKISIGAGVFPAPNKIDFQLVFNANLSDNPLALIAVSTVFGIFLILLIYARRQDKKDLEKVGVAPLHDNDPSDKYFYEISVYTGYHFGAGTTANVSMTLCGNNSELRPRLLWHPNRQCFQRGAIDTFLVSSADYIGEINDLEIWHDNSGFSPEWFLSKVVVRDLNENKSYTFVNDTWLAVEKGLEGIRATLFPVSCDEITGFKSRFKTTTQRNLQDKHLWFSVFTRPVNSHFTRIQRLSCCLTLLYCTMLTNAMFYQRGNTTATSESTITIGPFRLGVKEIGIGVMSALIIFPVNAFIVWIFRNVESKPSEDDIRAMKESSKCWWFYELFFCCFKSRKSYAGLLKIVSQSSNGDTFMDLDTTGEDNNTMVPSPSSCNIVEDIKVEIELEDKRKKSIVTLQKSSFVLPYWYIYLAWFTLCLTSIACAFFVVLYGLQFGKDVSARWISSMTITFIQDVLISEPLKVFVIAAVVAVLFKKSQHLESEEERVKTSQEYNKWDFMRKVTEDVESNIECPSSAKQYLKPLNQKELKKAKAKRLKELRTWSLLKELVLYVIFLLCLSTVTYRNKNPMSYEINKIMKDLFITGSANSTEKCFDEISNVDDFFAWTNDTLLNGLYSSSSWYDHQLSPEGDGASRTLYVIGQVRIRQTRVKENSCSVPKYFREIIKECHGWSSGNNKDNSCYDVNWTPMSNSSQCSPSSYIDPWKFYLSQQKTRRSMMSSKDSGFILDLTRSNRSKNSQTIAFLRSHKWLDARTREISIEMNIYSAPLNLFCLGTFTITVLPTNGMTKDATFMVTKLFALNGVMDTPSAATHVFVFFFLLIFIYRETKRVYRLKKKYFADFWNFLQAIIVVLILVCFVVFCLRLVMIEHLMAFLEKNTYSFVSFQDIAHIDMLLGNLIAILVFFSWLRVVKLLRFNQRLLFLQETLRKTAKPLAAFSVIFLTLFFAYVHFGYLIFARELHRFRNIPSTFVSLCSLFMGHFNFPAMEGANRILGPVFLFSAMSFGVFIIMNFSIALILESFMIVKADVTKRENEYELVEFVTKQLRMWIGLTGTQSPAVKPPRQPPGDKTTGENRSNDKFGRFLNGKASISRVKETLKFSNLDNILDTAEISVCHLEYAIESVLMDDLVEEVGNYKLLFQGLGLAHYDWLKKAKKKGDWQDQYQVTEKYSEEMKDDELMEEKLWYDDDSCSMNAFELTFEDDQL